MHQTLKELQQAALRKFYKTLKHDTENESEAYRAKMSKMAAELGITKYDVFPPLEVLIANQDEGYRTVCGIIYPSRQEADHQRQLLNFYKALDFDSLVSTAEKSKLELVNKAKELSVSPDWLMEFVSKKIERLKAKNAKRLEKYYRSLDVSNEVKAIEAKKSVLTEANNLEFHGLDEYLPLKRLLKRYDINARSVARETFGTREEASKQRELWTFYKTLSYKNSEENAVKALNSLKQKANELGIISSWLEKNIEKTIQHYDEKARTVFGHRFLNRKDAENVYEDEKLWFIPLWAFLLDMSRQNVIFKHTLTGSNLTNAADALHMNAENPFVYIHTTLMRNGKSGLAITHSGLKWNNTSELSGLISTVSFGFFGKKAEDFSEISWKDFFKIKDKFTVDEQKSITIGNAGRFACVHSEPGTVCGLLNQLLEYGKTAKFAFSDNRIPIPMDSDLERAKYSTDIPIEKEDILFEKTVIMDSDFDVPEVAQQYNQKSLNQQTSLKTINGTNDEKQNADMKIAVDTEQAVMPVDSMALRYCDLPDILRILKMPTMSKTKTHLQQYLTEKTYRKVLQTK